MTFGRALSLGLLALGLVCLVVVLSGCATLGPTAWGAQQHRADPLLVLEPPASSGSVAPLGAEYVCIGCGVVP